MNIINKNAFFMLFRLMPYAMAKKSNEMHRKMAQDAFSDYDRILVTDDIERHMDQMQLILDGVNEQFPDEKPMKLHLTGEVRGMRDITCARRGFIWTVYTVNR